MRQRHLDTLLLEQAYQATNLKQHIPNLTIDQIQVVLENASPSELEVIEEFLGGIRNLAKGAKEGLQRAGTAVKGAVQGAGQAVKAGAQQAGQNVKDMYQSGEDEAAAGKRKKQLADQLGKLEELFTQHIEASPASRLKGKNLNDLTLGQLKQALAQTAGNKERAATATRDKGVFGGVGGAAKAGFKQGSAAAPATSEPAGGAAPAPA